MPEDHLTNRLDNLAGQLLLTACEGAMSLQDRLAVLAGVGAWIAIRHHRMSDGSQENAGPKPVGKRRGFEDDSPEVQRQRALKRWNQKSDQGQASGAGLQALREIVEHR
jgi:hypothetical protein